LESINWVGDMKRSREVIIADILDICSNGASKTRIVYQANLNFRTVIPYLDLLTRIGMIKRFNNNPIIFKTTSNGIKLLDNLRSIQNELHGMGEDQDKKDSIEAREPPIDQCA